MKVKNDNFFLLLKNNNLFEERCSNKIISKKKKKKKPELRIVGFFLLLLYVIIKTFYKKYSNFQTYYKNTVVWQIFIFCVSFFPFYFHLFIGLFSNTVK